MQLPETVFPLGVEGVTIQDQIPGQCGGGGQVAVIIRVDAAEFVIAPGSIAAQIEFIVIRLLYRGVDIRARNRKLGDGVVVLGLRVFQTAVRCSGSYGQRRSGLFGGFAKERVALGPEENSSYRPQQKQAGDEPQVDALHDTTPLAGSKMSSSAQDSRGRGAK